MKSFRVGARVRASSLGKFIRLGGRAKAGRDIAVYEV